jgi:hypothetical protein
MGKNLKKWGAFQCEHDNEPSVSKKKRISLIQRLTNSSLRTALHFLFPCLRLPLANVRSRGRWRMEPHKWKLVICQNILTYKFTSKLMVYFHTAPLQWNMLTQKYSWTQKICCHLTRIMYVGVSRTGQTNLRQILHVYKKTSHRSRTCSGNLLVSVHS